MGFALQHLMQDVGFWSSVIFSDEKVFQSCQNGKLKVYRPRNMRDNDRYIQTYQQSGRFSVNMWAWVSGLSRGVILHVPEKLNSLTYIRILENVMLPSVTGIYRE